MTAIEGMEGYSPDGIFLGFDPGGASKFGVALLDAGRLTAATVDTVDDAMAWARGACGDREPIAAGVDTLLHWATSKSGVRPCDLELRSRYPNSKNSIMAPNSLFGAMAIGGVALALRLREQWPHLLLNETHPKVFSHALGFRYDPKSAGSVRAAIEWFDGKRPCAHRMQGEHQFDAALSAWATELGVTANWPCIIGDNANLLYPAGRVSYLWPTTDHIVSIIG